MGSTNRRARALPTPARRWRVFAIALVTLALGCPRGGGVTPEATLADFSAALREQRYQDAYGMMSRNYRRRVSLEDFERHLTNNPAEANVAANALSQPDGPAERSAIVTYGDGERLAMVYENGGWHLQGNVVDFYDQSTPRAALRSFVRAMERQRYDVVLRFVPDADREGMSEDRMREAWSGDGREEVEQLLAKLRANLDAPIEQVGERATMPYGESSTVRFVRESGVWKIEDPD
ncbi:MAG: hypothetical protein AAGF12_11490 [Myxococcota bacterium]